MATTSASPSGGGQRSRFSKLLLRSTGADTGPPRPPPKDELPLPSPASHASRSLPRTSSPTSRYDRPPIPTYPASTSSYSFTSSPSLQGGPNSPTLPELNPPSPSYPTSHPPSSSVNTSAQSYTSLVSGSRPALAPGFVVHPPAGGSGPPSSSTHLKGKKSWTLLKRPSSSTNLSFRSVENDELHPQRYASSSLPPRPEGTNATGWGAGQQPTMVPLADHDAGPSSQHGRRPSGTHELKRKGSRILSNMRRSGSAALLGKAAGGVTESDAWSKEEAEAVAHSRGQRQRKNSVNVNVHVWKGDDRGEDGGESEDAGIGMPFNVVHELHVESEDLSALPPEWVSILKAQGLSSTELLALAKSKSRSQMDRAAALSTPIRQTPASSASPARTSPSTSNTSPPRLPPLSYVSDRSASPPPPPSPARPPLGPTRMSSRLSLQLRDFQGLNFSSGAGEDEDWAQGLLSEALGDGPKTPMTATPTNPGPSRLPALVADSAPFLSPIEDRLPLTPREQRSDRLAKMGAGRRPSDPSSGGEEGRASAASSHSRGTSSTGTHPVTPAPPPGSYVPPTRKESRPSSQRSFSGSSAESSVNASRSAFVSAVSTPSLASSSSPPPIPAPLPLLPAPLLPSASIRRPLPSIPRQVQVAAHPSPPPPPSPARDIPHRQRSVSSSEESDGDGPLSNTFGLTGNLHGGRCSAELVGRDANGGEDEHADEEQRDDFSDDEPGLPYLDEEFGGRRPQTGTDLPRGNGTFGASSTRKASGSIPLASSPPAAHPTSPAGRSSSLYSQSSETSLVPSLNLPSQAPSLDRTGSHHSSRSSKPSLQMRNSPSLGSFRNGGVDSRLSVATAASRVTSMTPSFLSSGSHLSLDEEAIISRAVLVPSSSNAHQPHPHSHPTRHFATPSLSRPTKPGRLSLGTSNGSSAQPHPQSVHTPPASSLRSADSQQSIFEEAELALDEAVKMLNSPERAARMAGGGNGEQPTTPGTPAYSDFLHEFGGSEEEDGPAELGVGVQRRA